MARGSNGNQKWKVLTTRVVHYWSIQVVMAALLLMLLVRQTAKYSGSWLTGKQWSYCVGLFHSNLHEASKQSLTSEPD